MVALTPGGVAPGASRSDVGALAEVPKGLDLALAVALPVAGVAALRSLRAAGLGPDKRVLITSLAPRSQQPWSSGSACDRPLRDGPNLCSLPAVHR